MSIIFRYWDLPMRPAYPHKILQASSHQPDLSSPGVDMKAGMSWVSMVCDMVTPAHIYHITHAQLHLGVNCRRREKSKVQLRGNGLIDLLTWSKTTSQNLCHPSRLFTLPFRAESMFSLHRFSHLQNETGGWMIALRHFQLCNAIEVSFAFLCVLGTSISARTSSWCLCLLESPPAKFHCLLESAPARWLHYTCFT